MKIKTIAAIIAAAAACMSMTACGAEKINLNDYLETDFSGYNSAGFASFTIDIEELASDYSEAFGIDEDSDYTDEYKLIEKLSSNITGEFSETEKLSNGDIVAFSWNEKKLEKLEEKYSVKFKYENIEYTIEELDELKEFNPFDYLNVSFDGFAPGGTVKMSTASDMPVRVSFKADKSDNLSNGDVVTITVEDDDYLAESCLSKGLIVSTKEKSYTVEGLSAYVTKVADMPADFQHKLLEQAEDTISSYCSRKFKDGNTLKKAEFIGYYLLSGKEGFSPTPYNKLYCVYKVTANVNGYLEKNGEQVTGDDVFYTYCYLSDIKLLADGTCSADFSDMRLCDAYCESSKYHTNKYCYYKLSYPGFSDIDSMFNNCVTADVSKYNYENTVNN